MTGIIHATVFIMPAYAVALITVINTGSSPPAPSQTQTLAVDVVAVVGLAQPHGSCLLKLSGVAAERWRCRGPFPGDGAATAAAYLRSPPFREQAMFITLIWQSTSS
jgi:hypothetical protein